MSDQSIVAFCSPTLAGMKTGSLFTVRPQEGSNVNEEVRSLNRRLRKKGLRAVPARGRDGRMLIYLYRPRCLARDISQPQVRRMLDQMGYPCESPDRCVHRLIRKLSASGEFPHEIGLFLSYPPADVQGFMRDPKGGLECGCWKVYSDRESAEETFTRYRRCTEIYRRELEKGRTLEELAVDTEGRPTIQAAIQGNRR